MKAFILRHESLITVITISFYLFTFGLLASFDYSLLILAIVAVTLTLFNEKPVETNFLNRYLILFLISIAISSYFSINSIRSLYFISAILPALLIYYLLINHLSIRHFYSLFFLLSLFSLTITSYLLVIAVNNWQEGADLWIKLAHLTFLKAPNDIVFLGLLSPFSFIFLSSNHKTIIRFIALLSLFFTLILVVVYQSRLALLLFFILITLMLLLMNRIKILILSVVCLFAVLITIDILTEHHLFTKIYNHSWGNRIPLWLAALYMFLSSPIIGHGIGSYLLMYKESLKQHELLHLLSEDSRITPWAHNLYLEVCAEQGIIGFLALLLIVFSSLLAAFKAIKIIDSQQRGFAIAIFVSLVGFCFVAIFELSLWRQWVLIGLFILLGFVVRITQGYGN